MPIVDSDGPKPLGPHAGGRRRVAGGGSACPAKPPMGPRGGLAKPEAEPPEAGVCLD